MWNNGSCFIERELICTDIISNRIQTCTSLCQFFFRNFRTQQNVTGIDTVTTLLNQLDNMITEFRLNNLGDFLRILQTECHIRIRRVHHTTSHESAFAAFYGRCLILGIQTGQRWEVDFSFCHTIRIVAQPFLHIFDFCNRNFRLQRDNLHFYLRRNVRDTILRKVFEVTAYFCRSYFDFPD